MTTGRINQVASPSNQKPRGSHASGSHATNDPPQGATRSRSLPGIRLQQVGVPQTSHRRLGRCRAQPRRVKGRVLGRFDPIHWALADELVVVSAASARKGLQSARERPPRLSL